MRKNLFNLKNFVTAFFTLVLVVGIFTAVRNNRHSQDIRRSSAASCNSCYNYNESSDGLVDVQDVLSVANRWGAGSGSSIYSEIYDVYCSSSNPPDGNINVLDVQTVANNWNSASCVPGTAPTETPPLVGVLHVPQDYSTIEAAYSAAQDGNTILVAPGNYDVCLSGGKTKKIIIKAENPATKSSSSQQSVLNSTCSHVIQFATPLDNDGVFNPGEVVEFNGFVLVGSDDGFSYEGASGIVKDNIIYGQSDDPIDIDGGSEARIFGNILGRTGSGGGDGIENRLYSFSSSRVIEMIFMNNIIYNNPNDGIQLIDQTGSLTKRKYLIANNLIIGNGEAGIGTTQGGNSSQTTIGYALPEQIYVLHNTFVDNGWGGIIGGVNMRVYNNIFYNNGKVAVMNVSGSSVASNNLFFGNNADYQGSNIQNPNVTSDPNFVNTSLPPDFSSYQLGAGSPAIDAGRNVESLYSEFSVNPPGYNGSAPDIGWKEF